MDYELAKKLQYAGFKMVRSHFQRAEGFKDYDNCLDGTFLIEGDSAYIIPTLEELIEACGDGFVRMEKYKGEFICFDGYEPMITDPRGKTPTEAVANLWLELNK